MPLEEGSRITAMTYTTSVALYGAGVVANMALRHYVISLPDVEELYPEGQGIILTGLQTEKLLDLICAGL